MSNQSINVGILIHDSTSLFELACATELFLLPRPEYKHWYQGKVINHKGTHAVATANIHLKVSHVDDLTEFDMLVGPAWPVLRKPIDKALSTALLSHVDAGKRLVSFCSGAFLLGRLGLLNNKQATTHWRYFEEFASEFDSCEAVDNVLYCYDGSLGTSAGSAAALDLGLEIIRQDYGVDAARQVAKRLVIPPHRKGGQAQYVDQTSVRRRTEFDSTLDWAINNLGKPISVSVLAKRACMSRRTFDRRFKSQMGVSPKHWLIEQRLDLAQRTLERFNTPAEMLAEVSGFENAASLRHHFKRRLGVTPRQFRDNFLSVNPNKDTHPNPKP